MGQLGVHFAITEEQTNGLLAASDDDAVMAIIEEIEEKWDREFLGDSDKAWDAMHRVLTDGSLLYDNGEYPLNLTICGGRQLYEGEDYTVALVLPEQVKVVATALESLTEEWFRNRYFSLLSPNDYEFTIDEDDFSYTWEWFQNVRDLYRKASSAGRAVIFTVDA
jgi:hypothetical protein